MWDPMHNEGHSEFPVVPVVIPPTSSMIAQQQREHEQQQQLLIPTEGMKKKVKLIVLGAASAGKTSLLRQYFYHQFESIRMPTLGSDFYVGTIPISTSKILNNNNNNKNNNNNHSHSTIDDSNSNDEVIKTNPMQYIQLQMWDTPGKENFAQQQQQYHHHHHQSSTKHAVKYSASLSDTFFQHADAIMLVYDMTSSTSFTRLLKWYSDLMELFDTNNNAQLQNSNNTNKTKSTKRRRLPILIVANKLDLYNKSSPHQGRVQQVDTNYINKSKSGNDDNNKVIPQQHHHQQQEKRVAQRDVLGLNGIDYFGKNFQYEYQISPNIPLSTIDNNSNTILNDDDPTGTSTSNISTVSNNDQNLYKSKKIKGMTKRRMEISSYLVNRDNWTTDGSYLESLLQSEDGSHPDHDMVLLWCKRNGLQLVTISAATGEGINEAVETLILLALQNNSKTTTTTTAAITTNHNTTTTTARNKNLYQYNQELDLHFRYSNKNDKCCFFFPPLRNCFR